MGPDWTYSLLSANPSSSTQFQLIIHELDSNNADDKLYDKVETIGPLTTSPSPWRSDVTCNGLPYYFAVTAQIVAPEVFVCDDQYTHITPSISINKVKIRMALPPPADIGDDVIDTRQSRPL